MINAQKLGLTLYTIPELARKLDIGTGTVYKYIKQDRLIGVKIGRKLFIPEHSVISFLNGTLPTQQKDTHDPNPDTPSTKEPGESSRKPRGLFKKRRN